MAEGWQIQPHRDSCVYAETHRHFALGASILDFVKLWLFQGTKKITLKRDSDICLFPGPQIPLLIKALPNTQSTIPTIKRERTSPASGILGHQQSSAVLPELYPALSVSHRQAGWMLVTH